MDLHAATKTDPSGRTSTEPGSIEAPVHLDAMLREIPELARSIVSVRVGIIQRVSTAPDGEGGQEPIAELTEPFAIALAGDYERGATMIPPAEDAPQSLRTQLEMLDEYLGAARDAPPPTNEPSAPREFDSPLTRSVAGWLDERPKAASRRAPSDRPQARQRVAEVGSFPPPPPVPRFPLGAAGVEPGSSDISSLSPVATVADDGRGARTKRSGPRPWLAAALGGLAVAAAGALFLWTPGVGSTASSAPASVQAPAANCATEPRPASPPVALPVVPISAQPASRAALDGKVADAAMVVGASAASVCASGASDPRDAHVVVSFEPTGKVSARVTSPIDAAAARCVEEAFSRLPMAPFDGEATTRAATVHLEP